MEGLHFQAKNMYCYIVVNRPMWSNKKNVFSLVLVFTMECFFCIMVHTVHTLIVNFYILKKNAQNEWRQTDERHFFPPSADHVGFRKCSSIGNPDRTVVTVRYSTPILTRYIWSKCTTWCRIQTTPLAFSINRYICKDQIHTTLTTPYLGSHVWHNTVQCPRLNFFVCYGYRRQFFNHNKSDR